MSTIPVLVEESENENDTQESQRKKQKKKRSVKNVPTEETPTLTDSDNSDYNSDSEEETELSEEQLYRKAEREGIKIPKYFRSRLSLYKKERDEFVNRCKKEQEKIDKMKSISNEQKAKLSKDAMFKSLQSAAGIAKEQLDVSMHARVQLENHIFRVEAENLKMRGILEKMGVNTDEISSGDTLMAGSHNPQLEKMQRTIEILCMMQGINDQELQGDFDKYINQTLDRDSLEKKLKRFIINGAKGQQPFVEPDSSISNIVSNVNSVDNNTVHIVTNDVSVIIDEASTEAENSMANKFTSYLI